LSTFDDAGSAVPEQRRVLLASVMTLRRAGSKCDRSTHANAYNKRRAIIEWRQDPCSDTHVCTWLGKNVGRFIQSARPTTRQTRGVLATPGINTCATSWVLPTFDDLNSAFPEWQHELLVVADGLAMAGTLGH